jgi:hypothetical protein
MMGRMLEIVNIIRRSMVMSRCCRAIVIIRESLSKMKKDNPNKIAKRATRKVAVVLPARANKVDR